ncbi:uncharacterized protein LOC131844997 [Achroia grisella]|uniref:uncharacterized protein LOC131844997 n=1 Tax=Achroia grisella TaxID=688607 RepID=UPI0027D2145B|nr:uncharacterized protein LOC131844997 [Achroia grisella]
MLNKFWSHERVPEVYTEKSSEQELCEQTFLNTVKLENNQFEVAIPLKLPLSEVDETLGESFKFAVKRFNNLEKKLHSNPQLFIKYQQFIHEYLSLKHAHYVDIECYDSNRSPVYFLPHHAVINMNSKTTKLRVVFDGSMKTNKKISVNDLQLNGPVVQPTRCLHELAIRHQDTYPLASAIIINNIYVDDIIYSDNDLKTTLDAKDQLCNLLSLGSFFTHKWSSNDDRILSNISLSEQQFDSRDLSENNYTMKTLGLCINIKKDQFVISSPEPFESTHVTKKRILSYIGRFYDPMGFVSPIVVTAKAIMQKLWISDTNWNDSPPPHILQEWLQFTSDLAMMEPLLLDRNIDISEAHTVELIGFADASSTTAYGCCVYLRYICSSGTAYTHLLCSKSRINPIHKKDSTVPRLELNAALLLSKLIMKTHEVLKLKTHIKNIYLFSDSQIVLAWLKTESLKLEAYVANRVNVIRQNTARWRWLFVSSTENPADIISRGARPSELRDNKFWWHGPAFLRNSEYNFLLDDNNKVPAELPAEVKPCLSFSSNLVYQNVNPLAYIIERLHKYSDINKIIRLLAHILRFLNNINKSNSKIKSNFLSTSELNNALMTLIKYEQNKLFQSVIDSITKGNNVKGNLSNLYPFIDELGLLRVGGRLHYADIAFTQKHPIILPKGSYITYLLIRSEHEKLLHAGPKLVLANLNQRFWIVNGLFEVKKVTHKCITCFRNKATVAKQLMGSLPRNRVTVTSRPFEKIGVDFAGPIEVKLSRVRRSLIGKGYICVFVCFTTKAVHLELASDLTTETFLACLRRLISRRGLPTDIHCDNASTFKCAWNRLVELYTLQSSQSHQTKVNQFASQNGISFHFIPSYSPMWGGLWESTVKSTKFHLKRVLQKHVLTYEQLNTILTEIEAVLNSRPLLPLTSDPSDYCYLTPGHFIIGNSLTTYPEANNRPKWQNKTPNVRTGSLVILKEDKIPCMSWPMARVINVLPGHDGNVRAVEVKTPTNKTHIRSIHKICVLPIPDNYD